MAAIDVLVPVSDVGAAVRFYRDVGGLEVEGASDDFATLRAGESRLWLHREEDGAVPVGGVEVWISVEDVDGVHERAAEAGIAGLRPPSDVAAWRLRVTSAPDPDGRRVYFSASLD